MYISVYKSHPICWFCYFLTISSTLLSSNSCGIAIMREEGRTTLLYKNVYIFLFFWKELKLLWLVRQMDGRRQDRLLNLPITSSLDHSTLCSLQDPLSTSSISQLGLPNQRPLRATAPSGVFSLTASCLSLWPSLSPTDSTGGRSPQWDALTDCKLALTLAFTASNWLNCCGHLHVLFHNASPLPIRSHDLLPLIYAGASLIDGSVKGQHATLYLILSFPVCHNKYNNMQAKVFSEGNNFFLKSVTETWIKMFVAEPISMSTPQIVLVKRESNDSQKEQWRKQRRDNNITKMTIYLSRLQIKM